MRLAAKAAVITGGSRGIGRAIAYTLAMQGAKVALAGRNLDALEEVAAWIQDDGGSALAVRCDVSSSEDVDKLVETVLTHYGSVDILVNNAGINKDTLLMRMTDEDWDSVLDVNLKGMFRCTKAVLRPMLRQRSGRIINISSVVGLVGNAGQANYAAAKAAVFGFTKSVAREVASRGITVNAVVPGYIDTDMTAALSPAQREAVLSSVPLGRMGRPDEIAHAVAFLASDEAAYITGQSLVVDGGLTMHG